jgi:hypothetical protein
VNSSGLVVFVVSEGLGSPLPLGPVYPLFMNLTSKLEELPLSPPDGSNEMSTDGMLEVRATALARLMFTESWSIFLDRTLSLELRTPH